MMPQDDLRKHRVDAEQNFIDTTGVDALTAHAALALWVIAEQLGAISHNLSRLAVLADAVDPASGERFPGYVRVRIHNQEES